MLPNAEVTYKKFWSSTSPKARDTTSPSSRAVRIWPRCGTTGSPSRPQMIVVQNSFEELKRLVPTN